MFEASPVPVFHDRWLPERAAPAGYAALIEAYNLDVPLPVRMAAISNKHKQYEKDGWAIYTPRHSPPATLAGHLTFALKYEGVDLLVLKKLFEHLGPGPVIDLVNAEPTGAYARRTWFLYEWLIGIRLPLNDIGNAQYVDALDTSLQYGRQGENSKRHRVRDNLPGTPAFCPLVRRTDKIEKMVSEKLSAQAHRVVAAVPSDVIQRAAAFFLLKDTKSSFEIEGENPSQEKLRRWGKIALEAGKRQLSVEELERLQRIVLEDDRFLTMGIRKEEGFIGEHHRGSHEPLPDHISARWKDLPSLVDGLIAYDRRISERDDPVLAAAALAFGFVFIHPFADGNGRLHRYLIHHVLAEAGFNPPNMVFPVSSVMAADLDAYRRALESYSRPIIEKIKWTPASNGNVVIYNETIDLYRYFDATPQAEYLYECVRQTIEVDLPNETAFLAAHDQFKKSLKELVDMPQRLEDLLFRFMHQNNGKLPKGRRKSEFAALKDEEVAAIEAFYEEAFSSPDNDDPAPP